MTRNIKDKRNPWCWQSKSILRKIKSSVDRKELAHARNIYLTLTELASNRGEDEFSCYIFDISRESGCSEKTVSKYLNILEEIGCVEFGPQERGEDGKYLKRDIMLIDADYTERKIEESSEKDGRKFESQVTDIENKNKNKNKNKITQVTNGLVTGKKPIEEVVDSFIRIYNSNIPGSPVPRKKEGISDELSKVYRKYKTHEEYVGDMSHAIQQYADEIKGRSKDSDYARHRFSPYKFIRQKNGFINFLNS